LLSAKHAMKFGGTLVSMTGELDLQLKRGFVGNSLKNFWV
jgi:hypothetical protein